MASESLVITRIPAKLELITASLNAGLTKLSAVPIERWTSDKPTSENGFNNKVLSPLGQLSDLHIAATFATSPHASTACPGVPSERLEFLNTNSPKRVSNVATISAIIGSTTSSSS